MSKTSTVGRRGWEIPAVLLVVTLAALPVRAEPAPAELEKARTAWVTGAVARKNGKHAEALAAFETAHGIMGLPVTGIDVAKEREALGLLIEARDMALSVTRMDAATAADKQAQADALALYQRVGPRIGSITLAVSGPPAGAELRVAIDKERIASGLSSGPRRVNPGQHTLTVGADGYVSVTRTVQVAESATLRVDVELSPAAVEGSKTIPQAALDLVAKKVVLTLKDDTVVIGVLVSMDDRQIVIDLGGGKRTHVERGLARSAREWRSGDDVGIGGMGAAPAKPSADGVRIHIDSNDPAVSLYRVSEGPSVAVAQVAYSSYPTSPMTHPYSSPSGLGPPGPKPIRPSTGWPLGTIVPVPVSVRVCDSPCDRIVDTAFGDELFLGIDGYKLGKSFKLYGGSYDLTLRARVERRPSRGLGVTGKLLSVLGASALVAGGALFVMDATLDTEDLVPAGAATLGGGAAALGLGIGLFVRSRPIYEVDVPGDTVSRILSPTVAFAPPIPTRDGTGPTWVGASWVF